MLKRCEEITCEVCAGSDAELREFNGESDHVHPSPRLLLDRSAWRTETIIQDHGRPASGPAAPSPVVTARQRPERGAPLTVDGNRPRIYDRGLRTNPP
ncbi:hypothetical protein FHR34_007237 [Kitasatospora kifunensis]|uniref:Transposase n=1 Tax=Kitasatospora kifunensis TaxID=58351 RepID=A0A7W7R9X3_KITKI|nr:hypothetical protein [Kitasatospora kifunensis]